MVRSNKGIVEIRGNITEIGADLMLAIAQAYEAVRDTDGAEAADMLMGGLFRSFYFSGYKERNPDIADAISASLCEAAMEIMEDLDDEEEEAVMKKAGWRRRDGGSTS